MEKVGVKVSVALIVPVALRETDSVSVMECSWEALVVRVWSLVCVRCDALRVMLKVSVMVGVIVLVFLDTVNKFVRIETVAVASSVLVAEADWVLDIVTVSLHVGVSVGPVLLSVNRAVRLRLSEI